MALEFTPSAETIDPESLFGLLSKKSILPDQFLDPMVLGAVARGVGFGVIHEKADVAAVVLTYALEPGILGVTLIKERGRWDPVSYTHLTLPTKPMMCRSRWSPYH